jgi:hypothetical protein
LDFSRFGSDNTGGSRYLGRYGTTFVLKKLEIKIDERFFLVHSKLDHNGSEFIMRVRIQQDPLGYALFLEDGFGCGYALK